MTFIIPLEVGIHPYHGRNGLLSNPKTNLGNNIREGLPLDIYHNNQPNNSTHNNNTAKMEFLLNPFLTQTIKWIKPIMWLILGRTPLWTYTTTINLTIVPSTTTPPQLDYSTYFIELNSWELKTFQPTKLPLEPWNI